VTEDKSKTDITKTKHDPEKANNTKHNITKLAWFSRFLRHSARKRGGLIIQRSQTHTGRKVQEILATRYGTVCHQHMTTMGTFFIITGLTRAIPSCFFFHQNCAFLVCAWFSWISNAVKNCGTNNCCGVGGPAWLSQSHDVYDKLGQVVLFQHVTGYKIANQVKLTAYNNKCAQNVINLLSNRS